MSIYHFEINIQKDEYNAFVENHPYCNLLQSYQWADVKKNWDHLHTGVYDENHQLVAAGLVLIKSLPFGFTMFYLPRGPILDYKNKPLLKYYFSELKRIAKKRHCLFIKFDPSILKNSFHLDEEKSEIKDFNEFFSNLKNLGSIHHGFNMDFVSSIQPRFNMVVYKNDFGLDNLSKKGKKNYKIAQKKNIEVKIGSTELLEDFAEVMKCTEQRKKISLRDQDYYMKLLKTYNNKAFITLGIINLKKENEIIQSRFDQCIQDLENCPENAKKKRFQLEEMKVSLERQLKTLKEEQKIHGDSVCVCGTLSVVYGKTAEILYAGMNDVFKRYMAPYLIWYKTIENCFVLGAESANMGGIEGSLKGGLVDFKSVFYPKINEFIGEFDLPVNKLLFKPAQKAYEMLKKRNSSD